MGILGTIFYPCRLLLVLIEALLLSICKDA